MLGRLFLCLVCALWAAGGLTAGSGAGRAAAVCAGDVRACGGVGEAEADGWAAGGVRACGDVGEAEADGWAAGGGAVEASLRSDDAEEREFSTRAVWQTHEEVRTLGSDDGQNYWQNARKLYKNGDKENALKLYGQAYEENKSYLLYREYFDILLEENLYSRALALANKQRLKDKNNSIYHIDIGGIKATEGEKKKADKSFATAVEEYLSGKTIGFSIFEFAKYLEQKSGNVGFVVDLYLGRRAKAGAGSDFCKELFEAYLKLSKYDKAVEEALKYVEGEAGAGSDGDAGWRGSSVGTAGGRGGGNGWGGSATSGGIGSDSSSALEDIELELQLHIYSKDNTAKQQEIRALKRALFANLQKNATNKNIYELLIWLFLKENNLQEAFDLAKIYSRIFEDGGKRLLECILSVEVGSWGGSVWSSSGGGSVWSSSGKLEARDGGAWAGSGGKGWVGNHSGRETSAGVGSDQNNTTTVASALDLFTENQEGIFADEYIYAAKILALDIKFRALEENLRSDSTDFTKNLEYLKNEYENLYSLSVKNESVWQIAQNLVKLYIYYLGQEKEAENIINQLLSNRSIRNDKKAEIKLEYANLLLFMNKKWDAMLLYSQVEKDFKQDAIGSYAKLLNARLSYYIGEFDWALSQLDVLRAATSKLIANDAMELSLQIRENRGEDSTFTGLKLIAKADEYKYRRLYAMALNELDSLLSDPLQSKLFGTAYFKKAEIYRETAQDSLALIYYERVYGGGISGRAGVLSGGSGSNNYSGSADLYADDALLYAAEILTKQDKKEEAIALYTQIFTRFPSSLLCPRAKDAVFELRANLKNEEN